ncbi:amino acid ABC transporter ATP-binding protein [Legionella quateirensis]|uniref:ABC transporter ATP-binding protein n=1 Tax=Legionella quateirensis TaxID=45072 RepID=A0A378KP29_9GAMM|nr:ATP-binding cassette domain-containing protein [Legionella quateirensis]KTD52937.1 ABC transporter ATP-binding protein [Legionella quateirensis]STY16333.1 ABC transporter ATP-binding protein [Legionella quateirensis]
MLTIANACKQFGFTQVLNNINLQVKEHTILGLSGPSGSGKSTLLRCIQKLEHLNSGAIHIEGNSGFMFQDFQLFPHMTVLKNLTYAPGLHNKAQNHQAQAMHLLDTLGIADKAGEYPFQLSGGQKQRVALARSLMMQPAVLLCDEPTSGLDSIMIEEVIMLLKKVNNMGVTMIIASHDLAFLTQLTDRLVVLKNGRLIADIKPRELEHPIHYVKQTLAGVDYEASN